MSPSEADPHSATTDGLTMAPSLDLVAAEADVPQQSSLVDRRTAWIVLLAVGLGVAAAVAAVLLTHLIYFFTNLSFYGRISVEPASPEFNRLGPYVVFIPVAGAIVIGLMARYGSKAIRGHGIPEAMEQVLTN